MHLLEGSLMYTKLHLNPYWRLLLESWVSLHGGLVAYQTGGPELMGTTLWPMFAFGFAFVLVFTQVCFVWQDYYLKSNFEYLTVCKLNATVEK